MKKERKDTQYNVEPKTKNEVEKLIRIAEDFNSMIYDFIERITAKEIEGCRKELAAAMS